MKVKSHTDVIQRECADLRFHRRYPAVRLLSSPACRALSGTVVLVAGGLDPHRMTPLQRYLKQVQMQDGNSLRKMALRAHDKGFEVSAQRISQIINDPDPNRLTVDMIRALAAATGTNPLTLAALEDEGFFVARPDSLSSGQRRADTA